jgi:hypothetical protein
VISGFYTYLHRRADDGRVFYVGKGRQRRAYSDYRRTPRWVRTVAKHGLVVDLVAFFWVEADALIHERALIAEHRAAGSPLCNLSDGGEGPCGYKHTDEQRRKNSEARKGLKQSQETIAKRVAKLIGRPRSAETRAKIAASKIGKKIDPLHAERLKAINTGCVRSQEFKAKVSAGLTGRPVSAETRAKLSAAHTGRIISQDHRKRIAATLMGRTPSDSERANFLAWVNSPERRAHHSAIMKGRPWSEARRAAQKGG